MDQQAVSNTFRSDLDEGARREPMYRRGEGLNVWGNHMIGLANRLDAMRDELPAEAVEVMREVFAHHAQQLRGLSQNDRQTKA